MRMRFLLFILHAVLCVSLSVPVFAAEKKVVLASLNWPPYTGDELPGQGASAEVVRAAFKAVGYDVEIRIFPWVRAFNEARYNLDVAGYFPEYKSVERGKYFLFSDRIGRSALGLVERSSASVHWDEVTDLKKYFIGVVRGYVNTTSFDSMVEAGEIRVDESVSDLFNLRKVLAGRVDMAVADINLFNYWSNFDEQLSSRRGELSVNPHLLGINDMHVCFRNGRTGEKLMKAFNAGLQLIDVSGIQQAYFEDLYKNVTQ